MKNNVNPYSKKESIATEKEQRICREIVQYIISSNLDRIKDLQVGQLAKSYGIGHSYLSHIFKKNEKISLGEFLKRMKMLKCAFIMHENRDLNNIQLAEMCGYESINGFIGIFKDFVGISPGIYKKWFSAGLDKKNGKGAAAARNSLENSQH